MIVISERIKTWGLFVLILTVLAGCYSARQPKSPSPTDLPGTVFDAAEFLVQRMDEKSKSLVKYTPKENLDRFHSGWGMRIRNGLGLWGKNPDLLMDCARRTGTHRIHPDDASAIIIAEVWTRLQPIPLPRWLPPQPVVSVDSISIFPALDPLHVAAFRLIVDSLASLIKYPGIAQKAGVKGQNLIEIQVDQTGKPSTVRSIHGVGAGTNEAAEKAFASGIFKVNADSSSASPIVINVFVQFDLVELPPLPPE